MFAGTITVWQMVHQRHLSEGAWQESYTQGGHSSPACLLLGTMLQYPWQHASRLPRATLLDERWHPRAALEISLWHPTPPTRSQKHPNPKSLRAREKWCRDPDGFAPPPAWLITGPKRKRAHTSRSRRRDLSEQLEHAQDGWSPLLISHYPQQM